MEKIDVIIKECEVIGKRLSDLIIMGEKIIGLGITIIGAGMVYGMKENIHLIFLFLPVAISGVMLYGITLMTDIVSLGGYKRFLEEKLNTILGEKILLWETCIAKHRHRAFDVVFRDIIYVSSLMFILGFSLLNIWQYYQRCVFWIIAVIMLFLTTGLIISFAKMQKAFDITYEICKNQCL